MTILHQHALNDTDGVESLSDAPLLVTEHIFIISPDCKHDHHSVLQWQGLITDYLKSIKYNAMVLHKFTDSCSAQYKSRHCMGDVSFSITDLFTICRYYKTLHSKGPQDGAGANLKHKVDMAVITANVVIQNAHDFFNYADKNLKEPAITRNSGHLTAQIKQQQFAKKKQRSQKESIQQSIFKIYIIHRPSFYTIKEVKDLETNF